VVAGLLFALSYCHSIHVLFKREKELINGKVLSSDAKLHISLQTKLSEGDFAVSVAFISLIPLQTPHTVRNFNFCCFVKYSLHLLSFFKLKDQTKQVYDNTLEG
jgi:hypothetical protein